MILAIDIGGTFIKFGLVDDDFRISSQSKESTPTTIDDFWRILESIVSSFKNDISGIAIACPGKINSKHGFVFKGGLIPYLTSIPLGTRLSKIFQLPVKVINDADAAALAEARYGSLQDLDCGAALVLGTGVGLGLVSQGALLTPLSVTPNEVTWAYFHHFWFINRIVVLVWIINLQDFLTFQDWIWNRNSRQE